MKNFRLALMESIIGLEIVLTRYLTEYLRVYKGFSKKRIEDFISRELTLSLRLAGLLDLTLPQTDLQVIDFDKVRLAVTWRNRVTHRTGHLPQGIPESIIIGNILEVLKLTHILGNRAQQISASSEIKA